MNIVEKIKDIVGNGKYKKEIKLRFPSMMGDSSRTMTIQELKDNHSECMIIDPRVGEQVSLEDLVNLDIPEVVAMPPIRGG